jgi:hypothetical protein
MDLLDFTGEDMYFDRPLSAEVEALIADAADRYGTDTAELSLMRAYLIAPEQLTVLVALYRFFYYRQRYPEALLWWPTAQSLWPAGSWVWERIGAR